MKRMSGLGMGLVLLGCGGGGTTATDGVPYTPPTTDHTGAVVISIGPNTPAGPAILGADAYFLTYTGLAPNGAVRDGKKATCTRRAAGACAVVTCTLSDDPSIKLGPVKYVPAGKITVTRGAEAPIDVALDPQGPYYRYQGTGAVTPIKDGESFAVVATGGDVPAFSVTAAFVDATLSAPKDKISIASGADLPVSWTGGTAGKAKVELQGEAGSLLADLTCSFDTKAGSGLVPGTLLAAVDPSIQLNGTFTASSVAPQSLAGGWTIEVAVRKAVDPSLGSSGNGFTVTLTK